MENNELLKPLYEILDRVKDLVQLAQAEDWEAMDIAAAKYQQHVTFLDDNVYIKALQDADLVDAAKSIIGQIQGLNDDLDIHTSLQREKIASELRQLAQAGKAMDAYGR
ncbi:flagellar protein FliT [Cellvibrio sp.]|uniref:flagellar protein FliT n=1 Tax=Cellvibrio sp. TaxID=1965322 RepID=UPI0039647397